MCQSVGLCPPILLGASVEIIGSDSVYIDHDILEIFQEFKAKAHVKHIDFKLIDVPSVEITALH